METRPPESLDTAVFTDASKPDRRPQFRRLLLCLVALAIVYGVARTVVYRMLVTDYIQEVLHTLVGAEVERHGSISMTRSGDVIIRDAEVYAYHRGKRRLFYRAAMVRVILDGIPLKDDGLRVMRVDLVEPEIFARREPGGDWNVPWVIENRRKNPDEPWDPTADDLAGFPPNGVHVHDGTLHTTVISKTGAEVTWTITQVNASVRRVNDTLTLNPARGNFYGGELRAFMEISDTSPLTIDQLTVKVRDADVRKIADGTSVIDRKVDGTFNAVVAATLDPRRTRQLPILSGHVEITDGNLWEFPVFAGVLNLLQLGDVSNRSIDSALLEFTFEEDAVRVDKMHFLGHPLSLFGDGYCGLAGEWIKIVFVPRLGKSDWESILPVVGTPIQWLSDIFKGTLLPVVLTGSFENPQFSVDPLHFLKPAVKDLIEEKSPS